MVYRARRASAGLRAPDDAGGRLDAETIAAYRERSLDCHGMIEEAKVNHDPSAQDAAERELEWLLNELKGSVDIRGRTQKAGSNRNGCGRR